MSTERRPQRTRWYHHVVIVAVAVAVSLFFHFVRPSDQASDIILAICCIALFVTLTAIQIEKRRSPPRPPKGG